MNRTYIEHNQNQNQDQDQDENKMDLVSCASLDRNHTINDDERANKLNHDQMIPIEIKKPLTNKQGITGYRTEIYN